MRARSEGYVTLNPCRDILKPIIDTTGTAQIRTVMTEPSCPKRWSLWSPWLANPHWLMSWVIVSSAPPHRSMHPQLLPSSRNVQNGPGHLRTGRGSNG